ncbi:MAG: trypsin-like serine protease [Gammaproteobacteria bacterium]|nr:MAG: trypsin-like serine protease [Gammaproteobacteria bacterium]
MKHRMIQLNVFYTSLLAFVFLWISSTQVQGASLKSLFKRTNPSVVLLLTAEKNIATIMGNKTGVFSRGSGSGVVVSKDGLVVTAAHVVNLAEDITVVFHDGRQVKASVLSTQPNTDLALLQLKNIPANMAYSKLADSDDVHIGEDIYVIGAPYGSRSLSRGIISSRLPIPGLSGTAGIGEYLQTDAAINPGNSGGPMFNMDGEVVGIVSHILTKSGGFDGIGYAVSSNTVKNFLNTQSGLWAGIKYMQLDEDLSAALNVPQIAGSLLVEKVARGSLSDKLGLKGGQYQAEIEGRKLILGGDVIMEIMNIPLTSRENFLAINKAWNDLKAGETITMKIFRQGRIEILSTVF